MSCREQLIAELCLNGVEFKRLRDIGFFYSGLNGKSKNDFSDGNKKFITYMNVYLNKAVDINIHDMVKVEEKENQNQVLYGDILFTGSSETLDECGISSVLTQEPLETLYLNSFCFGFRLHNSNMLLPEFSKHLFRSNELRKQIIRTANGVTRFNVSKKKMENVIIPILPVEVQQEIVRILDQYTVAEEELEAKLQAELDARTHQFEDYRDTIFKFKKGIPRQKLADVATEMYRGSGIKRDQITESGTPCVRYGEIYTTYDIWFDKCVSYTNEILINSKKYFENGDILFAITGESVDEIAKSSAYVGYAKCLAGGDIVVMKHNENPKYLAYALSTTEAQMQKSKGRIKSKVVHSNIPSLKTIEIPIPPLAEQERIVSILDRLDRQVNELKQALQIELEARRKQYEYYRDKLLTFKELQV